MTKSNPSLAMGLRLILPSLRSRIERALDDALPERATAELQEALKQIQQLETVAAKALDEVTHQGGG
jgi:hypothetical protein